MNRLPLQPLALAVLLASCNTQPPGLEETAVPTSVPAAASASITPLATATTASSPAPPAARTKPSLSARELAAAKGLTLPAVEASAPAASSDLPLITITNSELLVGETRVAELTPGPLGFDAPLKRMQQRSALQVMVLDAALRAIRTEKTDPTIRVLLDRTTSYRFALEAFYTAAQTGFTSFSFVVQSKAGERSVPASTPSHAEWEAAHTEGALQPASFVLDSKGVGLSVGSVTVGTGCTKGAAGYAVATPGGKLDAAHIAACAARVRAMTPGWEGIHAANVTASPELDMETVLGVVVGIEASFPTVHFGMMSSH